MISFTNVTMESEKYICVRETGTANAVVIVDVASPSQPLKRPITADSALMNPEQRIIALKASTAESDGKDHLQIFNIEQKAKMKSHQMDEPVVFWKWLDATMLGIVTNTSVYHWSMSGDSTPEKVFDRTANLAGSQIISYKANQDMQWFALIGIAPGDASRPALVKGNMQLYSMAQQRSQALEAHGASFGTFHVPGNAKASQIVAFTQKMVNPGDASVQSKMHVIELGMQPGNTNAFQKCQTEMFFPPEYTDDFPVSMQISKKYGLIYTVTKAGLLFVNDIETGTAVYRNKISNDPVFIACVSEKTGGIYCINRRGQVILTTINESAVVPFVSQQLNNMELALSIAGRASLPGAEALITPRFDALFNSGDFKGAAELAAKYGSLRTMNTIQKFQQAPQQPGSSPPALQYFGACLQMGKLNKIESVELTKLVLRQNKKQLIDQWFAEDKLEPSEELGDAISPVDSDMALKLYSKAQCNPKVCAELAKRGDFETLTAYCERVNYTPNYMQMLQSLMMSDPPSAVSLAQRCSKMTPPPLDMQSVADLFLQRNMIREATSLLLDILKDDNEEQAALQTKVLEINLVTYPNVADAILAQGKLSHYDRPRIAQLCEKAGLYGRALQHYTELSDLKRCVSATHAIEPNALVEFFGTLSKEWALECLKELLNANLKQNLQVAVTIAKEYTEQLGVQEIMSLFQERDSNEGLFYYLGALLPTSENKEVHFRYIEAASKIQQIKEVERVTRESNFYDPERVKLFLMEAKLPDARPLINVCDRFEFISDLTTFLYNNNMLRYIEGYVQKVNPKNAPKVVGTLLDLECSEEFIKNLILSVRSLLPVGPLVEEVEKRNRLKMLSEFLEHLVNEGSQDPEVHNALGKMLVDSNNNPEHFLMTNKFYQHSVVGKYCERRDPNLACVAYRLGKCDDELVNCTNTNSMFKVQARYVVSRMEPELWAKVLTDENQYRRQLIDQVVSTALPESKNPEEVSVTVKAFMTAEMPEELIELLEKIVLQTSAFSNNPNLQNLLILTAIKADKTRVMEYVNRLDDFNGPEVGEIAAGNELYEEALAIYKKFNLHVDAMNILIESIEDIGRAMEYAERVDTPEVWCQLGKAQLLEGGKEGVKAAIISLIKAKDITTFDDVVEAARKYDEYEAMVQYLLMVRKSLKDPKVDTEIVYAYARTDELSALEDFLSKPNAANLQTVGDRCFDENLLEAAKVLFTALSNWSALASTLVRLRQFQAAVEAARKANIPKTWKEVCFACVEEEEFKLAQLCGLNIILQADELEALSDFYQERGNFEELIQLMEAGIGLDRAHMGIFTELGILYAYHKREKLHEHLKLFSQRINIPKLIRVCEEVHAWDELCFLYVQYDEYDNAAEVMMKHPDAWEHIRFKDVCAKLSNVDVYYKAIRFYLSEHPKELNDLLVVLQSRVDHARVVALMRKLEALALVKPYLVAVQPANLAAVNDAVNELAIEEEDFESLRTSIDTYDNCDQLSLAVSCEKHELIEFRRIAGHIYQRNKRWRQSIALSKRDNLFKDAMECAAKSGERDIAEELLEFFIEEGKKECFAACICTCYDLLKPDYVLEKAWMNGLSEYVMPYMIQVVREYSTKVDELIQDKIDKQTENKQEELNKEKEQMQQNLYAQLMPAALPAPPPMGAGGDQFGGSMGGADQFGGGMGDQNGYAPQPQYY